MLNAAVPLRATSCALFFSIVLSACGGGGNSDQPEPSAKPASLSNALSVDGGNSAVAVGQYPVDTSYAHASGTLVYDEDQLEIISPESSAFDAGFIFSQSHPDKFAVFFADGSGESATIFVCRSGSWSAKEVAAIDEEFPEAASVPLCPSGITIDPAAHSIKFSGLVIPSLSPMGKSVTLSADFSWVLQAPSGLTVETGSSIVPTGTYPFSNIVVGAGSYGDLILGQPEMRTDVAAVMLMELQGHSDKFILKARNITTDGGASEDYACASKTWTPDEITKLKVSFGATLSTCPDTVSFNVTNRQLTLNKTVLPVINATNGHQLVLSLSEVWPMPSFPISSGAMPAAMASISAP